MPTKPKSKTLPSSRKQDASPPLQWPALRPLVPTSGLSIETLLEDQIVVIRNFFTSSLCKSYVSFLSSLPLITTPGQPKKGDAVRVNDRFQVDDFKFAEQLWRATALLDLVTTVNAGDDSNHEDPKKVWGGELEDKGDSASRSFDPLLAATVEHPTEMVPPADPPFDNGEVMLFFLLMGVTALLFHAMPLISMIRKLGITTLPRSSILASVLFTCNHGTGLELSRHFDEHEPQDVIVNDESNILSLPTTPPTPTKTTWTLLIYLTGPSTGCVGGETVFYPELGTAKQFSGKENDGANAIVVDLEVGMALLHKHGNDCLLHEGREVMEGEKWVIRSDLCVKR
ncbi:MAG: hypothetical protein Q9207_006420 [Kuettlingeria erythrocarpa]